MKLLLDSHLLIWTALVTRPLPAEAKRLLSNPKTDLIFSAASLWEITIKAGLGKRDFQIDPRVLRRNLLDSGYEELPLTSEHTSALLNLPPIHGDPFDRILVAQATVEGITLLTVDSTLAKYPGPIKKI
jgi:PIN domain nuclease of toxin-antitoxin system